ncbi:MAG TPA: hypothetical protein VGN77_04595 [Steroidobacteraceae bacterium]|jgi:hypothetical protein|nr:hypothetical protein [Steroidobacteraceae bacterium]
MSNVTRWFSEISTDTANDVLTFQFPTRDIDPVGGVDRHSGVFVSVTELSAPPRGLADYPVIGTASLGVRNVAPADDGTVQLWLAIAPPDSVSLHVRLQFLVSND